VSPPANERSDPFALLGLPRRFSLDAAALRTAYLRRAAAAHPDRSSEAGSDAARRSAELNDAKRVLDDPLLRAEALLGPGASEAPLPPDFLMEMMELRSGLDEALASGDREQVAALRQGGEAERDRLLAELAELLDPTGSGGLAEPTRHAARSALCRLRYVLRLIDRAAGGGEAAGPDAAAR
jgi:molecular chaperone HscB